MVFEDLGVQLVKNIAHPVRAFGSAGGTIRPALPFARMQEIAALREE
jgi:hypothetical protein